MRRRSAAVTVDVALSKLPAGAHADWSSVFPPKRAMPGPRLASNRTSTGWFGANTPVSSAEVSKLNPRKSGGILAPSGIPLTSTDVSPAPAAESEGSPVAGDGLPLKQTAKTSVTAAAVPRDHALAPMYAFPPTASRGQRPGRLLPVLRVAKSRGLRAERRRRAGRARAPFRKNAGHGAEVPARRRVPSRWYHGARRGGRVTRRARSDGKGGRRCRAHSPGLPTFTQRAAMRDAQSGGRCGYRGDRFACWRGWPAGARRRNRGAAGRNGARHKPTRRGLAERASFQGARDG